jgi:hypothetical protein
MKLGRIVLVAATAAAAVVGVLAWRRRAGGDGAAPAQIGLAGGEVVTVEAGDPAAPGLLAAAAELRRALEAAP